MLLIGSQGGKKMTSGIAKSKKAGFTAMAQYVNNAHKTEWTWKQVSSGWDTFRKNFLKVRTLYLNTGFGLDTDDEMLGLETIDDKLDSMCPFFTRMEILISYKQNVNPSRDLTTPTGSEIEDNDDQEVDEQQEKDQVDERGQDEMILDVLNDVLDEDAIYGYENPIELPGTEFDFDLFDEEGVINVVPESEVGTTTTAAISKTKSSKVKVSGPSKLKNQ